MKPLPTALLQRIRRLGNRANRFAMAEMIRAALKVRHQNSLLGFLWNLVGPVLTLAVLYLLFRRHFGEQMAAYPVYLLTGIVVVGFFSAATHYLVLAFERTRDIRQNSLVPTETALVSNMAPFALRLGVEAVLCLLLGACYGGVRWYSFLMLTPLLLSLMALALGVGLLLGVLYTYTQDVEQIWMVAGRLFFFVTPVFYDLDSIPLEARALVYWFNPLTPVLIASRACVTPIEAFPFGVWVHGVLVGMLVLGAGYATYLRFEGWIEENA